MLVAVLLAVVLAGCGSSDGPRRAAPGPFTIVVLPDTQFYTTGGAGASVFDAQTEWIARHKASDDIAFVLHEGDIVNDNTCAEQWRVARAAMDRITGAGIGYLVAPGNHDVISYAPAPPGCAPVAQSNWVGTSVFDAHFPLSVFQAMPGFGGAQGDSGAVSYQRFDAGGVGFLAIALPFGPTDAELRWAGEIAAAHPDRRVLVVTHDYLGSDGELRGARRGEDDTAALWGPAHDCATTVDGQPRASYLVGEHCVAEFALVGTPGTTPVPGANDGVGIWTKLVSPHANIAFVFSGHVVTCERELSGVLVRDPDPHCPVAARRVSERPDGSRVFQLLANYQNLPDGGEGYLRLLRFDPAADTVTVRTYSPVLDRYLTDDANQFTLRDVGLR